MQTKCKVYSVLSYYSPSLYSVAPCTTRLQFGIKMVRRPNKNSSGPEPKRDSTKRSSRAQSLPSLNDKALHTRHEHHNMERQDYDEIDQFYEKRDKILLPGRKEEPDSTEEHVYELDSVDSASSDEDNELLSLEHANDMVARFVKKKELDSDLEDDAYRHDMPDSKAWGNKRIDYYNTDFVDKDIGALSENDKEVARMEEQEAREIQKRLAEEVDEDAFGIQDLDKPAADEQGGFPVKTIIESLPQSIEKNLSKLPTKKLMKMVFEESPELQGLLDDCRAKLHELNTEIVPMFELLRDGRLPRGTSAEHYLLLRHNLLIAYTTNVCFYLSLKANRTNIKTHPIIKRLCQFKRLISELDKARARLLPQVLKILEKAQSRAQLKLNKVSINRSKLVASEGLQASSSDEELQDSLDGVLQQGVTDYGEEMDEGSLIGMSKKHARSTLTAAEEEIMALYDNVSLPSNKEAKTLIPSMNKNDENCIAEPQHSDEAALFGDTDSENDEPVFRTGHHESEEEMGSDDETTQRVSNGDDKIDEDCTPQEDNEGDARRSINYQISKNKGLTPHRAKEMRNPRVRHRMKFRRANIRRKGQVRAMRDELHHRYSGETTGINTRVVKSVKLH